MSKGQATRDHILNTAISEASKVGLTALTIGGLAGKTQLSKSGLFAHFDSKEDLQVEVLRTGAQRFVQIVVAPALTHPRGEPRVRALFEGWLGWERSPFLPGGCLFVAAANELDDQPGAARDYLVQAQRDWNETLATSARIAVEEGHFRPDLDPVQFAFDLHSITLAYHYFHRLLRDPDTLPRCWEAFEALLVRSRAN